jgi:hypothetical protein
VGLRIDQTVTDIDASGWAQWVRISPTAATYLHPATTTILRKLRHGLRYGIATGRIGSDVTHQIIWNGVDQIAHCRWRHGCAGSEIEGLVRLARYRLWWFVSLLKFCDARPKLSHFSFELGSGLGGHSVCPPLVPVR